MTNKEYINQHPEQFKDDIDKWLFTEFGIIGGCCSAQGSLEYSIARKAVERWKKKEEPVSNDLEEAANNYIGHAPEIDEDLSCFTKINAFKAGAQWQKEHLLKPADGDDLPEIDREVIALLSNGKVVYAHRPQEYWDGKNIATGEVTRHYPVRHDKGGWNIPDVKWWLDLEIPKIEE